MLAAFYTQPISNRLWPSSYLCPSPDPPHTPCMASDIQAIHCTDMVVCLLTAMAYGEGWHYTDVH